MRLDKFLSESTAWSRKDIKTFVRQKKILVNGLPASAPDVKVNENTDIILLDGVEVRYRKYIYLMLNKPQGVLSATEDAHDPVVTELLPEEYRHFQPFPVGRLDKDTEGLLILTNDGNFDHCLTSPRKNIYKRYYAELDIPATPEDVDVFAKGIVFKDFTAKPSKLEIDGNDPSKVFIEIAEGKFHQVKRMCERVGKQVVFLKRVAIGNLQLDSALPAGSVRELTDEELSLLGYSSTVIH